MAGPEHEAIRSARPNDAAALVDLWRRLRGDGGTEAWWSWLSANPAGGPRVMLAERKGLLGCYAALPLRFCVQDEERLAALLLGAAVDRACEGLFAALGTAFRQQHCGVAADRAFCLFGWPRLEEWREGQRTLGYQNLRNWDRLVRRLAVPAPERLPIPADLRVDEVPRYGDDVDELWHRLRPGFRLSSVRDARALNWRYADHPERRYRLLCCRDGSGSTRGVAVYRAGAGDQALMVDWLLPAEDIEAMVALLLALERLARDDGRGELVATFNSLSPFFLLLQDQGFVVRGTGEFLVHVPFQFDTAFYRDFWYLTLGDSPAE